MASDAHLAPRGQRQFGSKPSLNFKSCIKRLLVLRNSAFLAIWEAKAVLKISAILLLKVFSQNFMGKKNQR